jgi:hypothetical protein
MIFELKNWLSEHKKEIALGIFIVLVATASFGLGYLFARDANQAPIIIEKAAQ